MFKEVREPLRITRSKIKQEKPSLGSSSVEIKPIEKTVLENTVAEVTMSTTKSNETVTTKEKKKKKYPMPILIKLEPDSVPDDDSTAVDSLTTTDPQVNDTFNVSLIADKTITMSNNKNPALNETVTVTRESMHENPNDTVTIERNAHDSLMTEDNDDDEPLSQETQMAPPLTKKMPQLLLKPEMKLKKNEVFK